LILTTFRRKQRDERKNLMDNGLIARYNYDSFVPEKFGPWMRFDESPALGERGPDFSLWQLDGPQTSLHAICQPHPYTVVEFGSFT
jgi:hypothetical protein